jgi:hypothetical protein
MNDPVQQLRAEIQALRAEFLQEIQSLRAENQALRSTISLITPTHTKTVLPPPTKFDGKPYRFKTWLPSIKAKITVDGEAIGNDMARFYYVWDNLEPTVQATVLPLLADAEERTQWDYQEILQQLQRVYTNPNEVREAQQALHKIRQNDSEPLPAYIARYERILYEAKGRDWPAAVKISTFRQGLNASIQRALDGQLMLPDDYPAFLQAVQRLASRTATYTHTPKPDAMDISAVEPICINTIDRVPASPRARSVPPPCRDRWRKAGKCVRCGSTAHWVQSCPYLPAVDKAAVAAVQPSKRVVPAAAVQPAGRQLYYPSDYSEHETEDDDSDDNCDLVYELSL